MTNDEFEQVIRSHAFYNNDELKPTDISAILGCNLTLLATGCFSRVYLLNQQWVVKEGRWDLDVSLAPDLKIPIPIKYLKWLLKPFKAEFQPKPAEIIRQYNDYLLFSEYFGYFTPDNYYHPQLEELRYRQKKIRAALSDLLPAIENKYHLSFSHKTQQLVKSPLLYTNYLPKEYLLYGPVLGQNSKQQLTSYIIQEYLPGKVLHDVELTELNREQLSKLLLLIIIILYFHLNTGLLPDTRPRHLLTQFYDWFYSTDNIILTSQNEVRYLDTRWLWPTQSKNLIKRGLVLPEIILPSLKKWLPRLEAKI